MEKYEERRRSRVRHRVRQALRRYQLNEASPMINQNPAPQNLVRVSPRSQNTPYKIVTVDLQNGRNIDKTFMLLSVHTRLTSYLC